MVDVSADARLEAASAASTEVPRKSWAGAEESYVHALLQAALAASCQASQGELGWFGVDFKTFVRIVWSFIPSFGVRRCLEMILGHMAPSGLNMSSY